ncbi:hypothetical protein [Alkalithermobacter paradoxus]|uniref:Uncharacterized protein n=1 Tax=Alkalithermobacter paradoxus TaxID=29349 RepID=A0A1V4ICR7_9FIRM|nr:hypothetical protein CLOTH_05900 [[Clostridium] thermoalcaliphilum]
MKKFGSFSGKITMINDFLIDQSGMGLGCYKLMSVENDDGSIVNFVISPDTYFVDRVTVRVGDKVTGYYDANAPVPLIFPPQYRALVMVKNTPYQNVKVDYFNGELISSDNTLRLILSPYTMIVLENDQFFNRIPINRNLIVIYKASTKSIPAQTVPYKIIVMC